MSYATILVHLDLDAPSDNRVRLAAGVAAQFHSTLIGIAAAMPRPPLRDEALVADSTELREHEEIRADLSEQEKRFRAITKDSPYPVEWRSAIDLPIEAVAREARAADLIVIGRERVAGDAYRTLDPGAVLLKAGRPVLVTPRHADALRVKRALIAWQDTREARRALQDALPFLHNIDEVLVTEICDERNKDTSTAGVADVAQYLSRHRIIANAGTLVKTTGSAGDEVLRIVKEEGIDLVVSGAYGHSRVGEWIFGGVTRDLLMHSPVCCLLSN